MCSILYRCEDMRDDEGGRQRDMFFLESSKDRRFEFLFHSPTFSHDVIRHVLFSLRFLVHTYHFLPGTDTLSFCNSSRSWVFQDAALLDAECVCCDQCVTRGCIARCVGRK